MRIQFEIKEKLSEIIAEILQSDKWLMLIKEENDVCKRVIIRDHHFQSEASVDISEHEIRITTAWSNYSYRLYQLGKTVWCEYIGAYRGLLAQKLLPVITPKEGLLDSKVSQSSLLGDRSETLRVYSHANQKYRNQGKNDENSFSSVDHPKIVYDEFIKNDMPIPPPSEMDN